jgi:SAM-dependent methyltransferase
MTADPGDAGTETGRTEVRPHGKPTTGRSTTRQRLIDHFNRVAAAGERWHRNRYYHAELARFIRFLVPEGARVLEIACGDGDLLASLRPRRGVGLDISDGMVARAASRHPDLRFVRADAEELPLRAPFDYIVVSDLIGYLEDVQRAFENLHDVCTPESRVVITYFNYLWEPILRLAQTLRLMMPQQRQNWLALGDIENLLSLASFEVIRSGYRLLLPAWIPGVSWLANRVVAKLPGIRKLCLVQYVIARPAGPRSLDPDAYSVSVIIPCRNERGNIENAVVRMPRMGRSTELIFVDGNSTDGTAAEIERVARAYGDRWSIRLLHQGDGTGKGDAVRKGFAAASGDILMILDADLTVPPEDLPKFFDALTRGKGEFINGTRLVYPMEQQAMRTLNLLGNKFFSMAFTWLLEQRFRDTLCGTKVLFRRDYERIAANRHYFGDFDPFGDFDLIFGASRLNLKIIEVPVRYRERTYGVTNISRFRHGWLLLRMCGVAFRKLKLT